MKVFYVFQKVLGVCINIIFIAFILIFFACAIFLIYFISQEGKILNKASKFLENKVTKELGEGSEVEKPELKIEGVRIVIFFPKIKIQNENTKVIIEDFLVSFNYLKLLFTKLELKSNIKKLDAEISVKESQKNINLNGFDLKDILDKNYILYIREFSMIIENLNLLIKKSTKIEEFKFQNLITVFKNENFDELDSSFLVNTSLIQKNANAFFALNCNAKIENYSCKTEAYDLENESIKKVYHLLTTPTILKYFKYNDGSIRSLEINFNVKKKLEFGNLAFDFVNFNVSSPYLGIPSNIKINDGIFRLDYKEHDLKTLFKIVADKDKNIIGEINFKNEILSLDINGENLRSEDIKKYWPKKYLYPLSLWLKNSVYGAFVPRIFVHVRSPMVNEDDLIVDLDFLNANLHYSSLLPDVKDAFGRVLVKNHDDVLIEITSGRANKINILNGGRAIFNIEKSDLTLDLNLKSDLSDLINFFIPSSKLQGIFGKNFKGKTITDLNLKLKVLDDENDMFKSTQFTAKLNVNEMQNPFFKGDSVIFEANKSYLSSDANLKFISGKNVYFNGSCVSPINSFGLDLLLNLKSGDLAIENMQLLGEELEIIGNGSFSYAEENPFHYVDFQTINFCENNYFSFLFSPISKAISIKGQRFHLQDIKKLGIYSFINDFNTENTEISDLPSYSVFADVKEIVLLNGANIKDLHFNLFNEGKYFEISSNLISGHKNANELLVKVPNVGTLIEGFNISNPYVPIPLKNGFLTIKGEANKKGEINGNATLEDYELVLKKMDFSSKEAQMEFVIMKDALNIKSLKLSNFFHTLIITGTINKDYELNLEAFYTPTSLDVNSFLSLVPNGYATDAFNYLTFGTLKDGLLTLTYDISGTTIDPKIEFKTGSTSKRILTKAGTITLEIIAINLVLLPLLAILIF